MKYLQNIFVIFIGIVFSLIAIEIAYRFFIQQAKSKQTWSDRPSFYFKDQKAATIQDYFYPKEKKEGNFRIAIVGDSYSFAPYMQFTDTFPKKLEQMLNLNDTARQVEVINYGVPAYSTSHEVAVTARAIEEQADLVILQVTLNDAEIKAYRPQGIGANTGDRFGAFEPKGWKKTLLSYWKSLAFVLERIHNQSTHSAYRDYFYELFENPKSWNIFEESFNKIKKSCDEKNIKLVAVLFPLFGTAIGDDYVFKDLHTKLSKFMTEKGVLHLDLLESYRGIPVDRIQVIPGEDRHPNEIAHRIAAEKIYDWLERERLVPDEFKISSRYSERLGISGKGVINPAAP